MLVCLVITVCTDTRQDAYANKRLSSLVGSPEARKLPCIFIKIRHNEVAL